MNDTLRQWLLHTGFYLFGIVTGATGMIYVYEQPKPTKPVVTVEQDGAGQAPNLVSDGRGAGVTQQARDAAPPLALEQQIAKAKADIEARFAKVERDNKARDARVEQRNKEFAFAQRKAAGVKTWELGEVGHEQK